MVNTSCVNTEVSKNSHTNNTPFILVCSSWKNVVLHLQTKHPYIHTWIWLYTWRLCSAYLLLGYIARELNYITGLTNANLGRGIKCEHRLLCCVLFCFPFPDMGKSGLNVGLGKQLRANLLTLKYRLMNWPQCLCSVVIKERKTLGAAEREREGCRVCLAVLLCMTCIFIPVVIPLCVCWSRCVYSAAETPRHRTAHQND